MDHCHLQRRREKRLSSSKCSDGEPTQSSVDSSVRDQTKEIEVIDLINHVEDQSSTEDVTCIGQNGTQNKDALKLIPQKFVNRLSKSITLSVEPVQKTSEQKKIISSSSTSIKLTPRKTPHSTSVPVSVPDNTLKKLAMNSALDIELKSQSGKKGKSSLKPSLSIITPKNVSDMSDPSVKVTTGMPKSQKPGPLSYKSRLRHDDTSCSMSVGKSQENNLPVTSETVSEALTSVCDTSTTNSTSESGVTTTSNSAYTSSTNTVTPKTDPQRRKRGRPRKYPVKNEELTNDKKTKCSTKRVLEKSVEPEILSSKKLQKEMASKNNSVPKGALKNITIDGSRDDSVLDKITDNTMDELVYNDDNDSPKASCVDNESSKTDCSSPKKADEDSKVKDGNAQNEEEEEYTCSACNIRFTSIYEHIKEHHNGEEVVVEVPEEEIKEDLKVYQNENSTKVAVDPLAVAVDPLAVARDTTDSVNDIDANSGNTSVKDCTTSTAIESNKISTNHSRTESADEGGGKNISCSKSVIDVRESTKGEWVQTVCNHRRYYQFVSDHTKLKDILDEMKGNKRVHPRFKKPVEDLFLSPEINMVEISHKPKSPFFVTRTIDFNNPIPMYVVERQAKDTETPLGGIASYIMANPSRTSPSSVSEDTKVIAVMKVVLGKDRRLTMENIVFKEKPVTQDMIPILVDVSDPEIPLLKGSKLLKWKCTKCLATTWKFPISKDTHSCFACTICHKPFASKMSLIKHMVIHERQKDSNNDRFCEECQTAFVKRSGLMKHMKIHDTHTLCSLCKLFVPKGQETDHQHLHEKSPQEQFPCCICMKVFRSTEEMKQHEARMCNKLVAKYKCVHCDKRFYSVIALSYHSREHKNVKIKIPCQYCDKKFILEKERTHNKAGKRKPSGFIQKLWHERIHTRHRPFLCSSCPKRFRNQHHHASHVTQAHIPPTSCKTSVHMCHVCDKVFQNASLLTSHLREHSVT
ncbi:uncharacterized protein LOC124362890 isoform X1 [Homalodisca vitripennis]|uniref:uncharacterized protein LOC124362890 isoform X1 n=1 Tax=Homalodisca vitripennis TaxID=197043 RepID=UPI001EEA03A0|nr:uncharacterized protein LOC124362890 isoform X1 [Homalodisca vitripennis]